MLQTDILEAALAVLPLESRKKLYKKLCSRRGLAPPRSGINQDRAAGKEFPGAGTRQVPLDRVAPDILTELVNVIRPLRQEIFGGAAAGARR
jgi:hypothetical protein